MTARASFPQLDLINKLSGDAGTMGFEIVDLAGFVDFVELQAKGQRDALVALDGSAQHIQSANDVVHAAVQHLGESVEETATDVENCAGMLRDMGQNSRHIATWVQTLRDRTPEIMQTLRAVNQNNSQIESIALQVNTLAINAKIEAARAGESGRGFAVVADAINELSQQTKSAAHEISSNLEALTKWISELDKETDVVGQRAGDVLSNADKTDTALGRMETSVTKTQEETKRILTQSEAAASEMEKLDPNLRALSEAVTQTSDGIGETHERIERLVDTAESVVQKTAALGGTTEDAPFIEFVQSAAKRVSMALEQAIETGKISRAELFSREYTPIPNTNPEQVVAPFTRIFDDILPPIQEPALERDPKVVFCAAVDQNGYLPTHNKKFSQLQSTDPVWNTANCRNRRIFDDRVGLKAGRNTEEFLLQVYRRDMGGGNFVMMKDLSAPIVVDGTHWGGLRFAYTF